jgi:hypothetical protein
MIVKQKSGGIIANINHSLSNYKTIPRTLVGLKTATVVLVKFEHHWRRLGKSQSQG